MAGSGSPSGEFLLATTTLISLQLASGLTVDELGVLAAFLTSIADNLALIATTRVLEKSEDSV